MTTTSHKVRFIKPPNTLKQRAGHGGISKDLIKKSQEMIENCPLDFAPYAYKFMADFSQALEEAIENPAQFENNKDNLVNPVMQLKANGGMFRYQLLSDVADIALQFLDALETLNPDALAVLKAHERTIMVIMQNKLSGDGGKEGYALVKELHKACNRYFKKHETD